MPHFHRLIGPAGAERCLKIRDGDLGHAQLLGPQAKIMVPPHTASSCLVESPAEQAINDGAAAQRDHDAAESRGVWDRIGRGVQVWLGIGDAAPSGGPVAADDTQVDHFHGAYGATVTGNVLANGGDPISAGEISLLVGPAHGTLTLNPDGDFCYLPDDGFYGLDRFWYQVPTEGQGIEQEEVCLFVDAPPPTVPHAREAAFTTPGGEALTGDLIGVEHDSTPVAAYVLEQPQHGTLNVSESGTFEYVPDDGFSGVDSFMHRIVDENNEDAVAIVTIQVGESTELRDDLSAGPAAATDGLEAVEEELWEAVTDLHTSALGVISLQADGSLVFAPADDLGDGEITFAFQTTSTTGARHVTRVRVVSQVSHQETSPGSSEARLQQAAEHGQIALCVDGVFHYRSNPEWCGEDGCSYVLQNTAPPAYEEVTLTFHVQRFEQTRAFDHPWDDPHFVQAPDKRFDILGWAGSIYNMVSTPGLHCNAQFIDWIRPGVTLVGQLGVCLGDLRLDIRPYAPPLINGQPQGKSIHTDAGSVTYSECGEVDIQSDHLALRVISTSCQGVDFLTVSLTRVDPTQDDRVHGLWGQTIIRDHERECEHVETVGDDGARHRSDRGDRECLELYEVAELFSTTPHHRLADRFFLFHDQPPASAAD